MNHRTLRCSALSLRIAACTGVALILSATAARANDTGDRMRRDADRQERAGNDARAREAREGAAHADRSTPDHAREVERDYNSGREHRH